jgi:serine/threonine-protein kinase
MTLAPGTRLGSYEVTAQIGVGGMGEVYRATDFRLGRAVAIKVLPALVAQDPDRLARFDREARTLAALNHPNIAAIHGLEHADGTQALVMELVEGPTLAERIAQGAIPWEDALPIARQIADALAAAHEQGIVHRDLKPANVKVRPDGTVKVLDFGLAKALEQGSGIRDQGSGGLTAASLSPTITSPAMTQAGLILGTAAYMSPEQARGKTVDKRADIWAFGCVLYEMLTGTRAFDAEDVSLTLSVVLQKEPDFAALPADVPSHVAQALRVCLRKDPRQRPSDINDVRLALEGAFVPPAAAAVVHTPPPGAHRRVLVAVAGGALILAAASMYAWWQATRPVLRPLARLSVDLGRDAVRAGRSEFSLSPDGTRIIFVGRTAEDTRQLFTRRLDEPSATPIPGTVYGLSLSTPFFSPEGDWIGYVAANAIWKVPAEGGSVIEVTKVSGIVLGASWGDDDRIVFSTSTEGGLFRVPAAGGAVEAVKGDRLNLAPSVLPGSRHVLVATAKLASFATLDDARIEVVDVANGTTKVLLDAGYDARYIPTPGGSGHLVFVQKGTLHAVAFDPKRLETRGTPVPLVAGVGNNNVLVGGGHYAVSNTGTFAYLPFSQVNVQRPLMWMTSTGEMTPLVAQPGEYGAPRFSPDGSRLAYIVSGPKGGDVWVHDLKRDTSAQLTFTAPGTWEVAWAPDSKHLVFSDGRYLWWMRADGSGEPRRLLDVGGAKNTRLFSFRADGRLVFGILGANGVPDLWTVPVDLSEPENPKAGKPEPFLAEAAVEVDAAFSPDGKFLAYASTEAGPNELFVRPFPGPGGKRKVSTAGGKFPAWSRTGELFFFAGDDRIWVVDYTTEGDAFFPGKPRQWAPTQVYRDGVRLNFDLAPDGKRVVVLPRTAEASSTENLHATFLLNFFDEVRRRIP